MAKHVSAFFNTKRSFDTRQLLLCFYLFILTLFYINYILNRNRLVEINKHFISFTYAYTNTYTFIFICTEDLTGCRSGARDGVESSVGPKGAFTPNTIRVAKWPVSMPTR